MDASGGKDISTFPNGSIVREKNTTELPPDGSWPLPREEKAEADVLDEAVRRV
jgi:hypothetical protein